MYESKIFIVDGQYKMTQDSLIKIIYGLKPGDTISAMRKL